MKRLFLLFTTAIFIWLIEADKRQVDFYDDKNILTVDEFNYQQVLDYVHSKKGVLLLHTYKDNWAACVGVTKNLKSIAEHLARHEELKNKLFIGMCNLTESRPLESTYFIGNFPKIYYYAWFENMRKRKFDKHTSIGLVMKWFNDLKPKEPEIMEKTKDVVKKMRQGKMHMVFGIFDNSSDPIYQSEYLEMANFFSHIPTFTCLSPCLELSEFWNLTDVPSPTILIYRKPEITPESTPLISIWNKTGTLIEFIEYNYHLPVDIYTLDSQYLYNLHSDVMGLFYFSGADTL